MILPKESTQYHHRNGRHPCHPAGESRKPRLRVDFDRRLRLEFHGSKIISDAGLLAYRELDDVLGLTVLGGAALSDLRRGKNTRHLLTGLLRQSVFGRLAGEGEQPNSGSRKASTPSTGRAYLATASATMRSDFNSMRSLITSATSYGRWPCRRPLSTGR